MKTAFSLWFTFALVLSGHAAVYQVGPARPYTNLQAVSALLQPGDVVEVDGDQTYPGDVIFTEPGSSAAWITIRGVRVNGNRPIISGGTNTVTFSTPWPYSGPGADYYIFEGFDLTAGSFRGVFHQAADLIIRDCAVHDCPAHGILGADEGSGSMTLEHVEVYNCGNGGSQHQIYMATDETHRPGSVFRMQYCYVHDGNGGNNVKSRAERNEIYYNWIEGAYYHELELIGPDGADPSLVREDSDVVGNVLFKRNAFYVTRVGGDGTGETYGRYRFVNNTFICGDSAAFRVFDGIESLEMVNNIFYKETGNCSIMRTVEASWGSAGEQISGRNNWVKTGATSVPAQWVDTFTGTDPGFLNFAGNDLQPGSGSALVDAGSGTTDPTWTYAVSGDLFPPAYFPPRHAVDPPGSEQFRHVDFALDIGAFEAGTTWFVDDDNTTGVEVGSRLHPYSTIQAAVDVAVSEDAVLAAQGIYTENIVLDDKSISLTGGFAGGSSADYSAGMEGDFSNYNPDSYTSGIQASDASAGILMLRTNASGSAISGWTISGGMHGIYLDDDVTWPLITNMIISDNIIQNNGVTGNTDHHGGGLYLMGEDIQILDNIIRNNNSGLGAGIYANVINLEITGNLIANNTSYSDHGGGLYLNGNHTITNNIVEYNQSGFNLGYGWGGGMLTVGVAALSGNIFRFNHAPTLGGAVFVDEGATAVLQNELIYGNSTEEDDKGGAGIYVDGGAGPSHADIINCTVADNTAPGSLGGNGVFVEGESSASVLNSIMWNNGGDDFFVSVDSTISVNYCISNESITGTGNMNDNPLFADALCEDYHLQSAAGRWDPSSGGGAGTWVLDSVNSPGLDAGNPSSDYSHEPDPNGSRVNIGVYGDTEYASKSGGGEPSVPAMTGFGIFMLILLLGFLIQKKRTK